MCRKDLQALVASRSVCKIHTDAGYGGLRVRGMKNLIVTGLNVIRVWVILIWKSNSPVLAWVAFAHYWGISAEIALLSYIAVGMTAWGVQNQTQIKQSDKQPERDDAKGEFLRGEVVTGPGRR
jgi:hypothetical protein